MTERTTGRPRIARIWRGRTKRERADEYDACSYEVGINRWLRTRRTVTPVVNRMASEAPAGLGSTWYLPMGEHEPLADP